MHSDSGDVEVSHSTENGPAVMLTLMQFYTIRTNVDYCLPYQDK